MKKLLALLLSLVLTVALAAPALAVERIIVLNNAHEDLARSSNRYNAYWLNAWNVAEVAKENFLFEVPGDTVATVVAYTDYYTDDGNTFETLGEKFISLGFNDEYDVICGPKQMMNAAVQYMGYIIMGPEAFLFMQEDGWQVAELFEDVGMAKADSYIFRAADGYTVTVAAADLDQASIAYVDDRIDGVLPGMGKYTLYDFQDVYVEGADQAGFEPLEGVNHITLFKNAKGVFDTDPPHVTNFGGVLYESFAVADLLAKFEIPAEGEVTVIAYTDGFTKAEPAELFAQKFMTVTSSKNTHPFTLGQVQPRNAGVQNAGYYILAKDAFFFMPEAPEGQTVENISLKDIFEKAGMKEAPEYLLTATDGFTQTVSQEDLDQCFIGWVDGRVDGIIPTLGGDSLHSILSIQAIGE